MPQLGVITVAENREEPCLQIATGLELLAIRPGLEHRVLNQIVGARQIAAQRAPESAQCRQHCGHLIQKTVVSSAHSLSHVWPIEGSTRRTAALSRGAPVPWRPACPIAP